MELVAFVGEDKENWGQIIALIKKSEWEKIILVKNKNTEIFKTDKEISIINIDSGAPLLELKSELMEKLKEKIGGDFEVAVSLASGTGKDHMALVSALLGIPVGVKLAVYTKEGVRFI